jgi:alkylresorcinol/alkylpyrone synthase/polyketide synthase Type III
LRGARLVSVGTATPPRSYTQDEVLAWAKETNPKVQRLFRNSHILRRSLYLPESVNGQPPVESSQELIDKHLRGALEIGPEAVTGALGPLGLTPADVDFLVCISSTGFLCPGISAHVIKHMGFRQDIQRLDIVGMGCNAAVNGLQATTALAQSLPGRIGLMLCVEVCSAAYVNTPSMSTAVVNSLFGDGAAAVVVRVDAGDGWEQGPRVVDFQPFILTDAIGAMRYDLEDSKLSFFLDRDIPFVIGRHVSVPVTALLDRHDLQIPDVDHWLVHSGGKKVIDAIQKNLDLSEHQFRHTRDVLRDQGNMSSGSVLFSLKALQCENVVKPNDLGVLIAMGPGTSIETALLAW